MQKEKQKGKLPVVFWCCCYCALKNVPNAKGKKWFQANAQAVAVIIVWFKLSLFDGDYDACAVTCIPYTQNCTIVSRTRKDQLPFSGTYQRNKETSQIIGEFMIFGVALVYLLIVCCNRCWYNADYNTYVIVDNYLKIKEDMISKDIRQILEEKLKTAMPELQNKSYYEDAIKNIKEHEDNYNDDNYIAVNIDDWVPVSSAKVVKPEPRPGTTEPGPGTTKSGPATTESGPGTTEPGPGTTESGPGTTEPGPGTPKSGPATTEWGPGTTEPGPGTTESGPGTTEPGPGTTESGPGTTEP
ncbi:uncharacterized protein LOC144422473 [Styela clava]